MASTDHIELTKEIEWKRVEVDALRKSLLEQEAVLRYLESKIGKSSEEPQSAQAPALTEGVIRLDQLIVLEAGRRTLSDEVVDVINRFGDQEFSVAHIDAVFQQQGIKAKGKDIPRSRISTAISDLEVAGLIERTFKGAGNVPHRYTLKKVSDV